MANTIEGRVVIVQFCPYWPNMMTVYLDIGKTPDPVPVQFMWLDYTKVTADSREVSRGELLAWLNDLRFSNPGGIQPYAYCIDEGGYKGITEAAFTVMTPPVVKSEA